MNQFERAASLCGLDPMAVGAANIRRAFVRGAARLGLDAHAYLSRLDADAGERRLLAGEAVVQETWLFRDPDTFAQLAGMAAALPRPVRALCVPCATGEEPASMAITFLEAGLAPEEFLIDAVDASPEALDKARTGRFGPASLRGALKDHGGHLVVEDGGARLSPEALSRIRFIEADAVGDSFLAGEPPYQVVFCRHLLIYLAPPARLALARNLSRLTGARGAFFASPAEAGAFLSLGLTPYASGPATAAGTVAPATGTAQVHASRDACAPAAPPRARSGSAPAPPPEPVHPAVPAAPAGDPARKARELADSGDLDGALALIEQAVSQAGPSAQLFQLKAAALLAKGREDEAEEALRRALYLDPAHPEALAHLELLHRARGREDEAELVAARARRTGRNGESRP
ncbi:CheR family methyltransferase [Fundidesulfovibrio terrae]|uniref:CheR family methyltransferase n=1 Tax=Fundidesulfovibrio terrae TaxID=2922866 RepID=UPI001FAED676|nr:CheR family methyltransferase [Fundidesulfovibrio terrae]